MATLNLSEIEKIARETGTILRPFQVSERARSRRGRGVALAMIAEFVQQSAQPVSCADIARHLQRKKTPHLWSQIRELVAAGQLVESVATCPINRRIMCVYSVTRKAA